MAEELRKLGPENAVIKVPIGGYVMEAAGLTWLFVISSLCGFLPFLVLHKLEFKDV